MSVRTSFFSSQASLPSSLTVVLVNPVTHCRMSPDNTQTHHVATFSLCQERTCAGRAGWYPRHPSPFALSWALPRNFSPCPSSCSSPTAGFHRWRWHPELFTPYPKPTGGFRKYITYRTLYIVLYHPGKNGFWSACWLLSKMGEFVAGMAVDVCTKGLADWKQNLSKENIWELFFPKPHLPMHKPGSANILSIFTRSRI